MKKREFVSYSSSGGYYRLKCRGTIARKEEETCVSTFTKTVLQIRRSYDEGKKKKGRGGSAVL